MPWHLTLNYIGEFQLAKMGMAASFSVLTLAPWATQKLGLL
jgi:hypothetical protein